MFKNITKKIMLLSACIIMSCTLTGCGETIQQYATTHLPEAIQSRAARNIEIATEFYEIGALSTAQYNKCVERIQKQADSYTADTESSKMLESLAKSVTQIHTAGRQDGKLFPHFLSYIEDGETSPKVLVGCTADAYPDGAWMYDDPVAGLTEPIVINSNASGEPYNSKRYVVMSNYLAAEVLGSGKLSQSLSETDSQNIKINDPITPVVFIDDSIMESLNSMVKMEVYVLKPEITTTTGINDLDGVIANIQKVTELKPEFDTLEERVTSVFDESKQEQVLWNTKVNYLNNYFTPALDDDGNPITLIDEKDNQFDLVKVSEKNATGEYKLGLDMWVAQDDIDDCLRIRFQEFNEDAVTKLREYMGDHKFYIVPDNEGSWKAYLMEYPIDVIDSLSLCTRTDDWATDDGGYQNVEVKLKKSGLGINLMTGKFVKYKYKNTFKSGDNFDWTSAEQIDAPNGYYLTTGGAQNNESEGLSSLVVKGVSSTEIETSLGNKIELDCGRIILRDYLEATYAPNYNSEGNLVVFGRKIRFSLDDSNFHKDTEDVRKIASTEIEQDVLVYERGSTVATFVDADGAAIPGSPTLEITDFCDAGELNKEDPKNCWVRRLPYKNEEPNQYQKEVESDTPDIKELSVDTTYKTIRPVTWFPSKDIGKVDYNADTKQKQRFYCIATDKGMFDSALYSSWVESTVPDASLDWWNGYLEENGFSYQVDHVDLLQYLTDNYKYELSQSGVIILDLETIEKIQDMYDEEADQKRVGAIRTAFVIIGWIMIFGSFLLMLLWVVDTNTDLGFGLLEKVTFGHWVAVKYESDIPAHNVNDQKYVTFKIIVIKTMIVIAIGILLLRVDIFWILTLLVDLFGEIASQIEKLIKGRI